MPEVTIKIGGREFEVACQEGEEHYLKSAAAMLDTEASAVVAQIGRMPEVRMLLMAGLMLADKAAGIEEQLKYKEDKIANLEGELSRLRSQPSQASAVPPEIIQTMAELAARAEALAAQVEERA